MLNQVLREELWFLKDINPVEGYCHNGDNVDKVVLIL